MELFDVVAILIVITALCGYLNHRLLRLGGGTGVMLIALSFSLVIVVMGKAGLGLGIQEAARNFLGHIQFGDALLHWMLGFLLFAGALTVDADELFRQRNVTAALAIVGTIVSMLLVAGLAWGLLRIVGMRMSWIYCLLLGALISPTDPIAVLALVRRMKASKKIETIIAGESLFNDGIGVVLFLTFLALVRDGGAISYWHVSLLFVRECVGGMILGAAGGMMVYFLLRRVHNFELEIPMTIALVMGIYSLSNHIGVSGRSRRWQRGFSSPTAAGFSPCRPSRRRKSSASGR